MKYAVRKGDKIELVDPKEFECFLHQRRLLLSLFFFLPSFAIFYGITSSDLIASYIEIFVSRTCYVLFFHIVYFSYDVAKLIDADNASKLKGRLVQALFGIGYSIGATYPLLVYRLGPSSSDFHAVLFIIVQGLLMSVEYDAYWVYLSVVISAVVSFCNTFGPMDFRTLTVISASLAMLVLHTFLFPLYQSLFTPVPYFGEAPSNCVIDIDAEAPQSDQSSDADDD